MYKIFNNNEEYLNIKNSTVQGRGRIYLSSQPPSTIITTTMQDARVIVKKQDMIIIWLCQTPDWRRR